MLPSIAFNKPYKFEKTQKKSNLPQVQCQCILNFVHKNWKWFKFHNEA